MRIAQHHFRILRGREVDGDSGFEACFAIEALGRWTRFGLFCGEAPGSHMAGKHAAFWRTRAYGLHGWNLRLGWWPKPCITMLLHTRRA